MGLRRRRKPDYKHIHELEVETGLALPDPEPPKKREMVPVREHALTSLSARLDPKTGGFLLEKRPRPNYGYAPAPSLSSTASVHASVLVGSAHAMQMAPGHKWAVNDPSDVQVYRGR